MFSKNEKIVVEFNEHTKKHREATEAGDWERASYYAFMANAISNSVRQGFDQALKIYFEANAHVTKI